MPQENKYNQYCPFCQREITPSNIKEYESGEDQSLIYIHDEGVPHDDDFTFTELH